MQRFTLIHDGSTQGWRTAYLAFHVAARMGAPLLVLLTDSEINIETPAQRAAQVEIGGRAARLTIETRIITDFSPETITSNTREVNGLFVPRRLVAAGNAIPRLLETLSCPLWIVSEDTETRRIAVLVNDLEKDADLIAYASLVAQRMGESLTYLVAGDRPPPLSESRPSPTWISLREFSQPVVISTLDRSQTDLLILRPANYSLVDGSSCSCVVYPSGSLNV